MARVIWVGVGAVGGVYAYRKGGQAVDAVREQGIAGTVQIVAASALHAALALRTTPDATPAAAVRQSHAAAPGLRVGRFRISRVDGPATVVAPAAIMDADDVIDITSADTRRATAGSPRRKAR